VSSEGAFLGVRGRADEGMPQGLKPQIFCRVERPKAKALGYLEAETFYTAIVFFALVVSCFFLAGCAPPRSSRVVIGAKNFTEQVVLGELLAQEIEAVTGQRVERRFYLA
jgi:hypothetical protein